MFASEQIETHIPAGTERHTDTTCIRRRKGWFYASFVFASTYNEGELNLMTFRYLERM